MDVAVAVRAVLHLAALELADRAADVGGDGARLRVRHEPSGPEGAAETADQGHHVGSGDGEVEVHLAGLDLGGEVIGADDVGSRGPGLLGGGAGGEHGHPHVAPGARGQGDGAANHLVSLTGVDPEADGHFDGLIELG